MFRFIFTIGIIFSVQSCSDLSKNAKMDLTTNSLCNMPCCSLSNEEIYEKSITYIKNELGIKNEFRMKLNNHGDTVLQVKMIPISPQFGGIIDLEIKTENCEIKILKIGK